MLRLLSMAALASAAITAAIPTPPASAMSLSIHNVAVGPRIGSVGVHSALDSPALTVHTGHEDKPAVKKWVCGPIVNYDGSPHCRWVTH